METKIIIALVASGSSIIVAFVSLIGNYINNKKILEANKNIESFKLEIEKKRGKYQIYDKELKDCFNALGEIIKKIQRFKDFLLFVLNATNDSLDSETVLTELKGLRKDMFSCYEENSHFLDKEVLKNAHSAKNYILKIENRLKELFTNREYINISKDESHFLKNERSILSDFQNVLRDERFKISYDAS